MACSLFSLQYIILYREVVALVVGHGGMVDAVAHADLSDGLEFSDDDKRTCLHQTGIDDGGACASSDMVDCANPLFHVGFDALGKFVNCCCHFQSLLR